MPLQGVVVVVVLVVDVVYSGAIMSHRIGCGAHQVAVVPLQRPALHEGVGMVNITEPVLYGLHEHYCVWIPAAVGVAEFGAANLVFLTEGVGDTLQQTVAVVEFECALSLGVAMIYNAVYPAVAVVVVGVVDGALDAIVIAIAVAHRNQLAVAVPRPNVVDGPVGCAAFSYFVDVVHHPRNRQRGGIASFKGILFAVGVMLRTASCQQNKERYEKKINPFHNTAVNSDV